MRSWLLVWALPGCVWLSDDDLGAYADRDGDGEPGLAYGGRDCFPDDPARVVVRCFADRDADGYGDPTESSEDGCACVAPAVENALDCDDGDGARNPDTVWYLDQDGDGHGGAPGAASCERPDGQVAAPDDCDDGDPSIGDTTYLDADADGYGAEEIAGCGGVDRSGDCDDARADLNPDTPWYVDADGDTYGSSAVAEVQCLPPSGGTSVRSNDCDDSDPEIHPGVHYFGDGDGDGFGDRTVPLGSACDGGAIPSGGIATNGDDCDDADPGLLDVYYDVDADGDGFAPTSATPAGDCRSAALPVDGVPTGDCDDADAVLNPTTGWYPDADGDGHGARVSPIVQCADPGVTGSVAQATSWVPTADDDCDDGDGRVFLGAVDAAPDDGLDQDCDGFDLSMSCGPVVVYDVAPDTLDAAIAGLRGGDCVALRLADGTYDAIDIDLPPGDPLPLAGLAIAGDPFGAAVVDGANTSGRTALEVDTAELRLEDLRFSSWAEGVFATVAATTSIGLRAVDVEGSGPFLRARALQGDVLGLSSLTLLGVTLTDGDGLGRPISADTVTLRDVTFDGAISSLSLLAVRDLASTSTVSGIRVLRSAATGPLLSVEAADQQALYLTDVEIQDSLGAAGLIAAADGLTLARIRVEDDAFTGGLGGLAIGADGRSGAVALDRASVRRNTLNSAFAVDERWVSTAATTAIELVEVEVVGNQSRPEITVLRTARAEAGTGPVHLRNVALHSEAGAGLLLEDVDAVDVERATVVGFASPGATVVTVVDHQVGPGSADLPAVAVHESVFVTPPLPTSVTLDRSFVSARFDPAATPFVLYGPTIPREYVDLRWSPSSCVGACPPSAPESGAYLDLASAACTGWDAVDDCDQDGMYDSWERFFFGSTAEDGTADRDGDGWSDLTEHRSGTIPVDDDTDDDGDLDGADSDPLGLDPLL